MTLDRVVRENGVFTLKRERNLKLRLRPVLNEAQIPNWAMWYFVQSANILEKY